MAGLSRDIGPQQIVHRARLFMRASATRRRLGCAQRSSEFSPHLATSNVSNADCPAVSYQRHIHIIVGDSMALTFGSYEPQPGMERERVTAESRSLLRAPLPRLQPAGAREYHGPIPENRALLTPAVFVQNSRDTSMTCTLRRSSQRARCPCGRIGAAQYMLRAPLFSSSQSHSRNRAFTDVVAASAIRAMV